MQQIHSQISVLFFTVLPDWSNKLHVSSYGLLLEKHLLFKKHTWTDSKHNFSPIWICLQQLDSYCSLKTNPLILMRRTSKEKKLKQKLDLSWSLWPHFTTLKSLLLLSGKHIHPLYKNMYKQQQQSSYFCLWNTTPFMCVEFLDVPVKNNGCYFYTACPPGMVIHHPTCFAADGAGCAFQCHGCATCLHQAGES